MHVFGWGLRDPASVNYCIVLLSYFSPNLHFPYLSRTLTHTHTHSHTLTHSHTHTLTHTLTLSHTYTHTLWQALVLALEIALQMGSLEALLQAASFMLKVSALPNFIFHSSLYIYIFLNAFVTTRKASVILMLHTIEPSMQSKLVLDAKYRRAIMQFFSRLLRGNNEPTLFVS